MSFFLIEDTEVGSTNLVHGDKRVEEFRRAREDQTSVTTGVWESRVNVPVGKTLFL
jgi:hypothetical protein